MQCFNAPPDPGPVVSTVDYTATPNQIIAATSLFSVTDADGNAITAYQFWDTNTDATSGHWIVGGTAQPSGQAIDVTPAQLSTATFQAGTDADQLKIRASDGTLWGAWQEVYVNQASEHPPASP